MVADGGRVQDRFMSPSTLSVRRVDAGSAPDGVLLAAAALRAALPLEVGDPPDDPGRIAAHVRFPPPSARQVFALVEDDGRTVGGVWLFWDPAGDNPHLADFDLIVDPAWRRRGIGTLLLREACEVAEGWGCRTLLSALTSNQIEAAAAFARAWGMEAALVLFASRMLVDRVDRGMLDRWIADAARSAADYDLLAIDGVTPEDLLEDVAEVTVSLNDAPIGTLDVEDETPSVEYFRAFDLGRAAGGSERWALYARHRATGKIVGWSVLRFDPGRPTIAWQRETGVLPDHRGHRLGRWMKAVNLVRMLEERPGVVEVRTENAHGNEHMLAINDALGFEPFDDLTLWQVPVADLRVRLDGRAASR